MCPLLSRRVPNEVVVSRASLDALETLEIERTLISRAALLSGSLVERGGEVLLRSTSDDVHVVITLVNDTWRLSTIEEDVAGAAAALIAGFHVEQAEAGGWAAQVSPAMERDLDVYAIDEHTREYSCI